MLGVGRLVGVGEGDRCRKSPMPSECASESSARCREPPRLTLTWFGFGFGFVGSGSGTGSAAADAAAQPPAALALSPPPSKLSPPRLRRRRPYTVGPSCAALDDPTTCTKEDSNRVYRRCSPSAKPGWGGVGHKKCAKLCQETDERLSAKCKHAPPPPSRHIGQGWGGRGNGGRYTFAIFRLRRHRSHDPSPRGANLVGT